MREDEKNHMGACFSFFVSSAPHTTGDCAGNGAETKVDRPPSLPLISSTSSDRARRDFQAKGSAHQGDCKRALSKNGQAAYPNSHPTSSKPFQSRRGGDTWLPGPPPGDTWLPGPPPGDTWLPGPLPGDTWLPGPLPGDASLVSKQDFAVACLSPLVVASGIFLLNPSTQAPLINQPSSQYSRSSCTEERCVLCSKALVVCAPSPYNFRHSDLFNMKAVQLTILLAVTFLVVEFVDARRRNSRHRDRDDDSNSYETVSTHRQKYRKTKHLSPDTYVRSQKHSRSSSSTAYSRQIDYQTQPQNHVVKKQMIKLPQVHPYKTTPTYMAQQPQAYMAPRPIQTQWPSAQSAQTQWPSAQSAQTQWPSAAQSAQNQWTSAQSAQNQWSSVPQRFYQPSIPVNPYWATYAQSSSHGHNRQGSHQRRQIGNEIHHGLQSYVQASGKNMGNHYYQKTSSHQMAYQSNPISESKAAIQEPPPAVKNSPSDLSLLQQRSYPTAKELIGRFLRKNLKVQQLTPTSIKSTWW
ncbi:unnamed protein product [Cyprideis torosa]|uniref:Uncharacterized protein n=1 Tax=Cyprideis torosa TaxID=163714 RepID=A0A7R8ZPF5_9CRUS|nr:unnamed protein product [Cyprideis torosa]CAG0888293.1 unnamed protein product [Cyprideis torosa]